MRTYEHYIVTLTSAEAMQIANLLACIGMALEGLTIVVPEGDGEMFRIEGRHIHDAHSAIMDALQNRWLGA